MLATAIQNVRVASEVYGRDAGYMWEAQVLGAAKTPLRVVGSLLVAAGTAVMAAAGWTGIGALIGGAVALAGATVSATANSIHVDAKSGKRSYQMTDEGALATVTDVVGGALGGYATYAARASNTAAAAVQAADTTAKLLAASETAVAAAVTAQTAQSVALGSSAAMGILQAGAEFDSRGHFTGQWSLEGSRGDSALIGAAITFVAAGTAGAAGLKQGTLASDLTKSGVSTGMNMMLQYQKMLAGHENSYAAMAESDFSDLGGILGTVMQSQSQDWQDQLANSLDRTHRASDSMAGLGVFARRDDEGNMRLDGAAQPAASAWGRFWEGGMSTLGGYGVLLGAIGSGIGAVAGMIGTGLGMAWNGLADGAEWTFQKLLNGGRKISNTIAGWADDYETYRVSKEMEAMHQEIRQRLAEVDIAEAAAAEMAKNNEEIARKLNTVKGYNEIAERLFAELKKEHPEWTYDQMLYVIQAKMNDMKSALMNNIIADNVYLNYGADKIKAIDRFERMIYDAQREASERSMAAFGIDRMSDAELTALGFNPEAFDTDSGMQARLYRVNGTSWKPTQFILGFRGTEGDGDIWADVVNAAGIPTAQYKEAKALAIEARNRLAGKGELSFTGHSLGGGLASLAAAVTGKNAVTFNAAGVPSMVVSALQGSTENIESRIKAYYLNGDGLSAVQDIPVYDLIFSPFATPFKLLANWAQLNPAIMPAYLPSAMGERIEITGVVDGKVRDSFSNRFLQWGELHRNTNMQRSLQREFR